MPNGVRSNVHPLTTFLVDQLIRISFSLFTVTKRSAPSGEKSIPRIPVTPATLNEGLAVPDA